MSEIALQLIKENKRTKDPILDLRRCELENYIPDELLDCIWLQKLILGNSDIGFTRKENLFKGHELFALEKLTQLQSLSLRSNQIQDISFVQHLPQLQILDLSWNQIQDYSFLQHLPLLHTLYLNNYLIKDISFLQYLVQLQTIELSNNQIQDISFLQHLTQLQTLDLSNNRIQDISSLQHLTQLQNLHLDRNKIQNCNLLQHLSQLQNLYLDRNKIEDISFLQHLPQLQILNISNNQIKVFPSNFVTTLPCLQTLYLYDNPIENIPPEIFDRKYNDVFKEIRDYLHSLQKVDEILPLYEAKLLLVGRGFVGKSELVDALTNENYEFKEGRKQTEGIQIKEWHPNGLKKDNKNIDFKVNIWDFGGQEIYYGTYQFFLSKNAVYLLVWDARQEEDTRTFDYWLRAIGLLSEGSPVIIVQNKADLYTKDLNQEDIKKNFPFVKGFYQTSCVSPDEFDNQRLKESLAKELTALPHVGEPWNKYRVKVRQTLEQDTRDYISETEYLKICYTNGLKGEEPFFLSDQLHHLGVILHFQRDYLLKRTVILKPEWATSAFYKIIDNKQIKDEQGGSFSKEDLLEVWVEAQYKLMIDELIELMKCFELCFQYENQDRYIVPEISSPNPAFALPNFSVQDSVLELIYQYEFMPKSIITRFICRNYKYIYEDMFWNSGVVLMMDACTAIVESSEITKKISIRISGKLASKVLYYIRKDLDFIHDTVKNPKYDELVPCKSNICKESKNPYYFKYKILTDFQQEGDEDIRCEVCKKKIQIEELIEGVKPTLNINDNLIKPEIPIASKPGLKTINIFIASSVELRLDREEFRTFISVENDRLVDKDIYLKVKQWEYIFDDVSDTRKQDDYNIDLKTCDLLICLFGTKVGKYTREEFDEAYEQFKKTGSPRIFTYFKKMHVAYDEIDEAHHKTYVDFKNYLKEIGHFPSDYSDMNDFRVKFKRNLDEYLEL